MKHLIFFLSVCGLACGSTQTEFPSDCNVIVASECYNNTQAACEAAGCPDDCRLLESYPAQVECPQQDEPSVECLGGWVDESGTGEITEGCNFRVGECCFGEQTLACREAGCPDSCVVLESYPAQIQCE